MEQKSNHPIAKSILLEAESKDIPLLPTSDFIEKVGVGVEGNVDGKSVSVSKKRFSKALRNLSQKVEDILWLHPRLKRGMRHLLPQLAEGTSVRLLALD